MPKHTKAEKELLPHLYGFPWYSWAHDFFHNMDRNAFLVAPNQVSKSSTVIRKVIHWATEPEIWKKVWGQKPTQFWYLYPTKDQAEGEWTQKWEKEFMPRGYMEHDEKYGWRAHKDLKKIHHVDFNSGVTLYFKSYEQSVTALQTSTVFFIVCDEELPKKFWHELNMRRDSAGEDCGPFNMVFTATLSQRFWYETMECIGQENERFPDAYKKMISMYDCQKYKNGKKTRWTDARIQRRIDECETKDEELVRVHGRFKPYRSAMYGSFNTDKNKVKGRFIKPDKWNTYISVFVGKTGTSAVCALDVSPGRDKAVIRHVSTHKLTPVDLLLTIFGLQLGKPLARYINEDAEDFTKVAISGREYFSKSKMPKNAHKSMVNALFNTGMLEVAEFKDSLELILQIQTIREEDISCFEEFEMVAAMILALKQVNFNFEVAIHGLKKKFDPHKDMDERERMYRGIDKPDESLDSTEAEISNFNDYLGA